MSEKTMITKVSDALSERFEADFAGFDVVDWSILAKAAIEAMGEPTDLMINAGYEAIRYREVTTHKDAREVIKEAINAALNEPSNTDGEAE